MLGVLSINSPGLLPNPHQLLSLWLLVEVVSHSSFRASVAGKRRKLLLALRDKSRRLGSAPTAMQKKLFEALCCPRHEKMCHRHGLWFLSSCLSASLGCPSRLQSVTMSFRDTGPTALRQNPVVPQSCLKAFYQNPEPGTLADFLRTTSLFQSKAA